MRKQYRWQTISVILLLVLLLSLIATAKALSNSTKNLQGPIESCAQSPIRQNVTLRGGINAGSFKKLAQFVAMQLCIRLCCEEKGCDVALMSGKNCYGVQCFSEELCTAVLAKKAPSSLMISHVTIKGEEGNSRRIHPVPQNLKCAESKAEDGVTLKGGISAGNFTDVGSVESVDSCTRLCCVSEKCDLALIIKGHCFLVSCFTKELCKTVKSETKNYQPTVAFVRRWVTNVTEDTAITLSNLPATNSKLMCKNSDIKYNSTLKGGIKAGNFTDLGKISEISTCIRMCCGRKDCDVALMLEANCYAVNCYNEDLCQPVLARKSGLLTNLSPRLSYITSRDEEALPQEIAIGNGMYCRPSVVSYDVTLRGGLSAGKFTPIGHVDNMEACVHLCCKRNTCDIALMLRDSCYAITCASEELCEEVPAPSSDFYPRLSYVRRDIGSQNKKVMGFGKLPLPISLVLLFKFSYASTEESLVSEITNVKPLKCPHGPILSNVTLRHELRAGKFSRLGKAEDMETCIQMCCDKDDCEMAFMPGNHCYGVDCFSQKHCEITTVKPSNVTVKIAAVRPIAVNPAKDQIAVSVEDPSTQEELHCTQSPILKNVTLRGGIKAGNFSDLGDEKNMHMCIALCCERKTCDLAFMIGGTCIAVDCFSEELCQAVKARPTKYDPQIAFIRRRELQRPARKANVLPTAPSSEIPTMKIHEIISDKLPHPTILKTSTCSASKIYPNVTLLGGIKSGNFTSLGKTKNMQECIGKTCELGSGDLAFMLGSYCYSVTCSSGRVCQTIPAQPSKFYPRIAFLKWAPKINETELLEDEGADYTAIPKCTRSHILYNHTLLGGLRAGNFTHIAEVDSIETCAALCCAEQTCDLALVLGENCYAGDCASKELCVPVPVHPTANKGSQIAYITSRKKVEEPGTDWSLWYIIVGSIAIGIGITGIMWTLCTCWHRGRRLRSKDEPSDRFTMMNECGDSPQGLEMLPQGWNLQKFGQQYNNFGDPKCIKNGPMFLSDSESDSDEDTEVPRRNRIPSLKEAQSIKKSLSYNGPPPPCSVERFNGPSVISLDSKSRRAMQNL
ncbi:hypothetical protein pdam_00021442 [Pocillopora damicornis]|uniref:MANSC domain-containing protein n=1 Tax=Pocillopora damicornis TaxID=46731 RepID=A0A3M6V394_POCDA|nr:hypothetical protein pdam_00021442 [Pocillopora damicornis]